VCISFKNQILWNEDSASDLIPRMMVEVLRYGESYPIYKNMVGVRRDKKGSTCQFKAKSQFSNAMYHKERHSLGNLD
jgi:hypothetical protein